MSADIAVIITVYNTLTHLSATLDSVLAQTFQNFEVILVDDGSTPSNQEQLKAIVEGKHDPRIKLFLLDHRGRAKALNQGIHSATAPWISILDADDLWHPQKLACQWEVVHNQHLAFIGGNSISFHQESEIDPLRTVSVQTTTPKTLSPSILFLENRISHCAILIKKELIYYDETLKSQVDYDLWMRLIERHIPLFILLEPLAYHRIHPGQSFEGRKVFCYRVHFLKLRLRYAIRLNKVYFIPLIILHFGLGLILNRRLLYSILKKAKP